jgi:hypothetical protein
LGGEGGGSEESNFDERVLGGEGGKKRRTNLALHGSSAASFFGHFVQNSVHFGDVRAEDLLRFNLEVVQRFLNYIILSS